MNTNFNYYEDDFLNSDYDYRKPVKIKSNKPKEQGNKNNHKDNRRQQKIFKQKQRVSLDD